MKFTLVDQPTSDAHPCRFPLASAYIMPEPLLGYWKPTLAVILLLFALAVAASA